MLRRQEVGNQVRYRDCPVFEELASILRKTSGLPFDSLTAERIEARNDFPDRDIFDASGHSPAGYFPNRKYFLL